MMLHPSYDELKERIQEEAGVALSEDEQGSAAELNSRYSIVMATAKRARQITDYRAEHREQLDAEDERKALSVAVDELYNGEFHILGDEA